MQWVRIGKPGMKVPTAPKPLVMEEVFLRIGNGLDGPEEGSGQAVWVEKDAMRVVQDLEAMGSQSVRHVLCEAGAGKQDRVTESDAYRGGGRYEGKVEFHGGEEMASATFSCDGVGQMLPVA